MRNVLVHAHIFKNAGTTFDDSLRRNFADGFVDHREDKAFLEGRNSYLLDYLKNHGQVRALSSHSLHFRLTGNEQIRLMPVYFLRHPIARVWSVYHFEKQQTGVNTEGARRAKEMDLNSYVAWYMEDKAPATIRNIHTIFLSGSGPSPARMAEKFVAAKKYLEEPEPFFAVVERYDESMLALESRLENLFPELDLSYIRKNVTAENPLESADDAASELLASLESDVAEKLEQANSYDMALYQLASNQLSEQMSALENADDKLDGFRKRCSKRQAG